MRFQPEKLRTKILTKKDTRLDTIVQVSSSAFDHNDFVDQLDALMVEFAKDKNYDLNVSKSGTAYHIKEGEYYLASAIPYKISSRTNYVDEHATKELGNHRDYPARKLEVTTYSSAWEFKNRNNKSSIVRLAKELVQYHNRFVTPAGSGQIHNLG